MKSDAARVKSLALRYKAIAVQKEQAKEAGNWSGYNYLVDEEKRIVKTLNRLFPVWRSLIK